jgi:hypothetical protein
LNIYQNTRRESNLLHRQAAKGREQMKVYKLIFRSYRNKTKPFDHLHSEEYLEQDGLKTAGNHKQLDVMMNSVSGKAGAYYNSS